MPDRTSEGNTSGDEYKTPGTDEEEEDMDQLDNTYDFFVLILKRTYNRLFQDRENQNIFAARQRLDGLVRRLNLVWIKSEVGRI